MADASYVWRHSVKAFGFMFMVVALGVGSAAAQTMPATAPATQPAGQAVMVRGFRFTGNTAYSSERLAAVVREYAGQELTFERLDDARRKVSEFYVSNGYTTSGAVL